MTRFISALVASFVLFAVITTNSASAKGSSNHCSPAYLVHLVNPNEHMQINAQYSPPTSKVSVCQNGDYEIETIGAYQRSISFAYWHCSSCQVTATRFHVKKSRYDSKTKTFSDDGFATAFYVLYWDPYGYKTVNVTDLEGKFLFKLDDTVMHGTVPALEARFG